MSKVDGLPVEVLELEAEISALANQLVAKLHKKARLCYNYEHKQISMPLAEVGSKEYANTIIQFGFYEICSALDQSRLYNHRTDASPVMFNSDVIDVLYWLAINALDEV